MVADTTARLRVGGNREWAMACTAMAIAGLLLFAGAIGVLMAPHAAVLGSRLPELTCLQLAFTPARAAAILGSFDDTARAAIGELLFPADMVFALGYGLQNTGLLGLLLSRLPAAMRPVARLCVWAPLMAAGFDVCEDVLLYLLNAATTVSPGSLLPLAAGIAATTKYVLLSLVTPAFGVWGVFQAARSDRSARSVILYVLVLLSVVPLFIRTAQQVPACF